VRLLFGIFEILFEREESFDRLKSFPTNPEPAVQHEKE
jgi:hypothetical protein